MTVGLGEAIRVPGRRLAVLLSGRGSNMASILKSVSSGTLDAEVALVFSNRRKALGLRIAKEAGIPTAAFSHRAFPDRASFDRAILRQLRRYRVDVVCLAGFMRILSSVLVTAYPNRIVNIHPSLLPAFPGLDAHGQALRHGVRVHGCTVHLVNEGLDEGPILLQATVPVFDHDTSETLAARVLPLEHTLLPKAIGLLLDGRFRIRGRRAILAPPSAGSVAAGAAALPNSR